MLDVITTVSESTPANYVSQCRRSVLAAMALVDYPVNYIEVPGVPGHIGNAMAAGLALCTSEYVAWVDDDDFVLPNAFSCLENHMDGNYDMIQAREVHLLANGMMLPQGKPHHLTAYRRSRILDVDLSQYPSHPNTALHLACPNAAQELSWVYMYRIRCSDGLALRARATKIERSLVE